MTNVAKVIIGTVATAATVAGAGCALVYKFAKAVASPATTTTNTDDMTEVIDVPTEENSETNNDVETDVTE
jgi:hypothetical protein